MSVRHVPNHTIVTFPEQFSIQSCFWPFARCLCYCHVSKIFKETSLDQNTDKDMVEWVGGARYTYTFLQRAIVVCFQLQLQNGCTDSGNLAYWCGHTGSDIARSATGHRRGYWCRNTTDRRRRRLSHPTIPSQSTGQWSRNVLNLFNAVFSVDNFYSSLDIKLSITFSINVYNHICLSLNSWSLTKLYAIYFISFLYTMKDIFVYYKLRII